MDRESLQWIGGWNSELAKNSTVSDLVNKPFKITEDRSFKSIIRFKAIAAVVLKFAIPEFRDNSLAEIARAIVDRDGKQKTGMTDAQVLDDEIDFLPSEAGVKDEKQTYNDAVFMVSIAGKEVPVSVSSLGTKLTVDIEMQNRTTDLGYNLISRAVYYGASLLRDTVSAGDSKYKGIHKVYSVWLCNERLPDLWSKEEVKERYVHTYSIWRKYEDHKYVYRDKEADLMQIVMVKLPKLRAEDGEAARMLYKLFNETQNIVSEIERAAGVTLLEARKGIGAMVDYETLLKETNANYETLLEKANANYETLLEEANTKAVKNIVKCCYRLKQDDAVARAYVLNEYPDIDVKLLDRIISEIYGLQETHL